jgi:hypothetical protein
VGGFDLALKVDAVMTADLSVDFAKGVTRYLNLKVGEEGREGFGADGGGGGHRGLQGGGFVADSLIVAAPHLARK